MSVIKTLDELMAMPIGSEVYRVENNDVIKYKIACHYPSEYLESVLITFGTNDGCSKWISKIHIETGRMFTEYDESVDKLLLDMEADIKSVRNIYKSKSTKLQEKAQ
jgi:hypothetical protein